MQRYWDTFTGLDIQSEVMRYNDHKYWDTLTGIKIHSQVLRHTHRYWDTVTAEIHSRVLRYTVWYSIIGIHSEVMRYTIRYWYTNGGNEVHLEVHSEVLRHLHIWGPAVCLVSIGKLKLNNFHLNLPKKTFLIQQCD
jgi:hypothetical protein